MNTFQERIYSDRRHANDSTTMRYFLQRNRNVFLVQHNNKRKSLKAAYDYRDLTMFGLGK